MPEHRERLRHAGELVRAARETKGWTQSFLGTLAKLNKETINRFELGGNVGLETVFQITDALGINSRDLFCQPGDLQSGLPQGGPPDVPEVDARLVERLRTELADEEAALSEVRKLLAELGTVAARRAESVGAALKETTRSGSRRSTR